jgi:hypothetical protein
MLKFTIQTILKNAPRTHPFRNGILGHKWWVGFKEKHPDISQRCVDGLEMKRASGLNRDFATNFYNLLEQVYNAHEYHPNHIWNEDETRVCAGGGNFNNESGGKRRQQSSETYNCR